MNIENIKNKICIFKGKTINFKFNGARNKVEEFSGIIIDTYSSIFTVKTADTDMLKSFSYSDVLIHKLVIRE